MTKPSPFGDDCERPSCDGVKSMFEKAMAASGLPSKPKVATKRDVDDDSPASTVECPPNSAELGRGSWTLLHSMAAWYPDNPSPDEQTMMTNFFEALARFYPCTYCADDFAKNLRKSPVPTDSRKELCQWVCEQHNLVNKKLGKKAFPCDMNSLDERWRKSSDPNC